MGSFEKPAQSHLRMLGFESRTGGFNDPEDDFELDVPAPVQGKGGHVLYEMQPDGDLETTFVEDPNIKREPDSHTGFDELVS